MTAIGTILCAVDQSDISRRALSYAATVAQAQRAQLHLVLVAAAEAPEPDSEVLRQFATETVGTGLVAEVTVRQGPVAREILAETERTHADLLVLGSHGRHGFQRLVLGSVTTKILHTATCPVLVVPPGAPPSADLPFRTILCPTDFSAAGNAALAFARVMAAPGDTTTLLLAHVVEWPFGEAAGEDAVSELRRSLESQAQEQLDHLAATQSLVSPAPEIQTLVAAGKPARELCALARSKAADLIVMGVTGRGAIDLALLGSTTHQVVRAAPCPVLTVPLKHGH
jgi:nucleotide-binding universal stress UspA family protein